jgi:(E)-4-hydroxy-3-methylbut-2-enyl-diphosphate synthase
MNPYNYIRRKSDEVKIGNLSLGGKNPIRVQSMANTNTNDIENSVAQCLRIVEAGGELVRFTTQGIKEAESVRVIHSEILKQHCNVPLVADVHFNAQVADYTAEFLEKVRVNPGNYVSGIKSDGSDYTEEEYKAEFEKIKQRFVPFLNICKKNNTAVRIGVNHGSLSERMLLRWGNTAEGMVQSCLEFLRICKEENFNNVVISMKASNTVMMIESVRLLVKRMDEENLHFPIHLGVTEAGDGEDGRVKSAVGIGGLLVEGIGDTIRVSLSEEPEAEIPVAMLLRDYINARKNHPEIKLKSEKPIELKVFERRKTTVVKNIGGDSLPVVISHINNHTALKPDFIIENNKIIDEKGNVFSISSVEKLTNDSLPSEEIQFIKMSYDELNLDAIEKLKENPNVVLLIESNHQNPVGEIRAFIHTLIAEKCETPVILIGKYQENDLEALQTKAATDLGIMFVDNFADGILIENNGNISENDVLSLSFGILQASRVRTSKTEFISCPGCGRTLFNLQSVIAKIKSRTSHLTGLKIGIMGCIVNGPGEMADADYGYVGAGRGKISLYKKQDCIEKNIPEDEALDKLIELIKANGDWCDERI